MAKQTPIPQNPIGESFVWRDWFQKLSDRVFGTAAGLDVPIQPEYGGTGITTYNKGDIIYSNATDNLTRLAAPASTSVLQMTALGVPSWTTASTGTVTSVGGTGTVNGLTLTGTVTSSGNLTLGGTLDLSSPPAIGSTAPAAGAFTTLTATTAVAATSGGTGLSSYSTGDLIYCNSTNSLTKLSSPASTSILQMTSAGTPSWITTSWTSYTPTWTSSGTAPSLGNGTISGKYAKIGNTVFVRVHLVIGSTTTTGTGNWRISLPVAAASSDGVVMPATYLDNGVSWYTGLVNCEYDGDVNYVVPLLGSNPSGAVTNTAPFTWNSGDALTFNGSYESA